MNYYDNFPCSLQLMRPNGQPMAAAGSMPSHQVAQPYGPLPTGIPTGPSPAPIQTPTTIGGTIAPQTLQSKAYIPGYLTSQIGRRVRVEFLIGSNGPLVDRNGVLVGVGASYILLRPDNTDDILLCDLYSIKFVTFYS